MKVSESSLRKLACLLIAAVQEQRYGLFAQGLARLWRQEPNIQKYTNRSIRIRVSGATTDEEMVEVFQGMSIPEIVLMCQRLVREGAVGPEPRDNSLRTAFRWKRAMEIWKALLCCARTPLNTGQSAVRGV